MIDTWMVVYTVWTAVIATVFYALFRRISFAKDNAVFQELLLLVWVLFIAFFVVIINPQTETGIFYFLNMILGRLIAPSFIVLPLPVLEKKTGTVFGNISVFSGAFIVTMCNSIIGQAGIHLPARPWQAETLLLLVCLAVISAGIFYAIHRVQQALARNQEEKPATAVQGKEPPSSGGRTIIILAVCLVLLCSPQLLLDVYMRSTSTCTGFSIDMVDQSLTTNATIIHLTNEDLSQYPKLGSIIRNSQKNAGTPSVKTNNNMTDLGNVQFSCNEESQIDRYRHFAGGYTGSGDSFYLEYNGTFYLTGMVWIH